MITEKKIAEQSLIEAIKGAEGVLSNLLNTNQITGVITRAPLEKVLSALKVYKQKT